MPSVQQVKFNQALECYESALECILYLEPYYVSAVIFSTIGDIYERHKHDNLKALQYYKSALNNALRYGSNEDVHLYRENVESIQKQISNIRCRSTSPPVHSKKKATCVKPKRV
ncbi:unnamed protein product [Didymodactylos carnosus]|uniref:Uncharacterized protein n=1 Tax=Didymodactylos carnosus TaxID=1234261 RepID=A0A814F590_9BILA|nr:unnamed protein product [Didymodactylos carnosus]CAF1124443.1 unnamed protein product [Didymodactylos carnosus]CAF3753734.1 unnamed protein product [Didymodactylos carnosus]CAF3900848.1 unnamed protein product [Didymodactylos carnosus]